MAEAKKDSYISRKDYLEQLISYKDEQLIKVITGMRRSGKSTLLFDIYADWLADNGVTEEQIIKVDLESMESEPLYNPESLYKYITDKLIKNKPNYVFIDEVQNCKDFQKVADSLYLKKGVDVYITGSNAHMFSGELATLLSGRYVTVEILPLSFKEYLETAKDENASPEKKYRDYVRFGSLPKVAGYNGNMKKINAYLDGIYNTIFKKDIIDRNKITNVPLFEDVMKFVMSNIGSHISPKSIADYLTSNRKTVYSQTVDDFLKYLTDSYMIYKAVRFDIKGKELLKSLAKYYVTDLGIRNYLLGYRDTDTGHILENVIYLELLRKGYKVFVGKVANTEVDFVAVKQDETVYIQVAESVKEKAVLERELAPLKAIRDFNPRLLVTMDYDLNGSYDGIKHVNALDFLTE
ncbi:MAG: ATP-binding protein [Clostridiales bacterium]|jgi:predicted AAA+ superfamily ATPase|nr:ATP-binding protein [Clostridiales bacterium]